MGSATLVVAVSGWTVTGDWLLFRRPGGDIRDDFVAALSEELRKAAAHDGVAREFRLWRPKLPLHMFSARSPEEHAQDLFEQLDTELRKSDDVESIVLLGYSCGAVLARRLFCMAHGMGADARFTGKPAAAWAAKIDRIVTLSGITRGWEFSSATPAWMRFFGPALKWPVM